MMIEEWAFYVIAFFILCGGLGVLLLKDIMHAAFSLMICLAGLACIYIYAGAEFVGVTQLLIYVGGIVVILIFGIMVSPVKKEHQDFSRKLAGFLIAVSLSMLIISLIYKIQWPTLTPSVHSQEHVREIGINFFTENLLAFEAAGALLLVALIGTMAIAGNRKI